MFNNTFIDPKSWMTKNECFDWCTEQHYANDMQGLWIIIWSSAVLLFAWLMPKIYPFIDDFIDEKTIQIAVQMAYNSALMLNFGFLLWNVLQ